MGDRIASLNRGCFCKKNSANVNVLFCYNSLNLINLLLGPDKLESAQDFYNSKFEGLKKSFGAHLFRERASTVKNLTGSSSLLSAEVVAVAEAKLRMNFSKVLTSFRC